MDFKKLREACQKRQEEWGEGKPFSLSFRGNELAGEVGEVCNEVKKLERHKMGIAGGKESTDDLADEMGDVLISIEILANDLGIDLWEAVKNKFNKTSVKHGFKTRID